MGQILFVAKFNFIGFIRSEGGKWMVRPSLTKLAPYTTLTQVTSDDKISNRNQILTLSFVEKRHIFYIELFVM